MHQPRWIATGVRCTKPFICNNSGVPYLAVRVQASFVRRTETVMTCLHLHPIRTAVSLFSVGLLAAISFAFAQQPDQQQQTWNPNGGWRRVGDPPRTSQSNAPSYPAISSDQQPTDNTVPSD